MSPQRGQPGQSAHEAELAVLAAILYDPAATEHVFGILEPEDFSAGKHRAVYAALKALHRDGVAVDPILLAQRLEKEGEFERAGGWEFLGELLAGVPTAEHIDYHAEIVRNQALARRLARASREIQKLVEDQIAEGPALAAEAERIIRQAIERQTSSSAQSMGEVLPAVLEDIDRRATVPDHVIGIPSGITELDAMTGGWRPGQYVIIGARPSIGKTALSWYMSQQASAAGHPTLYVSLEMSITELIERALARLSGVPGILLQTGRLRNDQIAALLPARAKMASWPLWIDETARHTVSTLRLAVRRAVRQHGVRLVVVDYLQLLRPEKEHENEAQNVRDVSAALKALARELGITVICCSQLSRAPEGRTNERPKLSDLRESGAIEQDADIVLLLWEKPGLAELATEKPLTVIVAKHRNGPRGEIELRFARNIGEFYSAK